MNINQIFVSFKELTIAYFFISSTTHVHFFDDLDFTSFCLIFKEFQNLAFLNEFMVLNFEFKNYFQKIFLIDLSLKLKFKFHQKKIT